MSQERSIETTCNRHARECGVVPKKLGLEGWPDEMYLAANPPRPPLFVEFKKPGGRRRPLQKRILSALRSMGYRAEFVESIEEFDALLAAWLKEG